jgi:hypothetical protein
MFALIIASMLTGLPVTGFPAYAYSHSIGENIHLGAGGVSSNFSYLETLLEAMHIHSVRSGLSIATGSARVGFLNTLAEHGITNDEIVSPAYLTTAQVYSAIAPIQGVAYLEGPNEEDVCCNEGVSPTAWVEHDLSVASVLAPFIEVGRNALEPSIQVLAPAVATDDPALLGNLTPEGVTPKGVTPEVDAANVHLYTGARPPETPGWGGVYFNPPQVYGSIGYNLAKARRDTQPTTPVMATEEGYSSAQVSEATQASYVERSTLWAFLHGVARQWLYELVDDSQKYGVVRSDGSLKPVAQGLAGLLEVTDDTSLAYGSCTLSPTIATTVAYDSLLLCKTTGEKDLILWQPSQLQDPNSGAITPATPTSVTISVPSTTGSTVLYTQSPGYAWSGVRAEDVPGDSSRSVTTMLTERPLVVAFDSRWVDRFPALPRVESP